jgi:hypothetical protein
MLEYIRVDFIVLEFILLLVLVRYVGVSLLHQQARTVIYVVSVLEK